MSATQARKPARPRITYVVIVLYIAVVGPIGLIAVYGPYRSFRRAEGDAKAWDGTVEPVKKPAEY